MKKPWTPWHRVVALRDDVRTGELSLSLFAADLYDVAMQVGRRPTYEDPGQFFSLTYPTYNLRELARGVALRLAGRTDKAVRQLELTYGGGKTHSLITLHHLFADPDRLPEVPAVQQFRQHVGFELPRARVAALPFDKLDVEKGMEVLAPDGSRRMLSYPWSALAFQIAGDEGLKILHARDLAEERATPPAENLLAELLGRPAREGLATLVLLDEVLMYARVQAGHDPSWRDRLTDFFQYLTQAATRVDRCAIVASLLATDPARGDELGKGILRDLHTIFRRQLDETVHPVVKEDVAEVLRRRFFKPASIADPEAFRPHVVAVVQALAEIDETVRKERRAAEERFLQSYPFHPDLTEVLYSKWTNLDSFQRTRGILRTFALALRDSEGHDQGPLVAPNVFLAAPDREGLSEASRELAAVASREEYEGRRHEWSAILEGELAKAREIQREFPHLSHRELEQAVMAVFLHSQPIGHKAQTREVLALVGATRPDRIELEKGLAGWIDLSWFLDEAACVESGEGGRLPATWRLGTRPNLRQMHHDSRRQLEEELVWLRLTETIEKTRRLVDGAQAAGARAHMLPLNPSQVKDDGEFHYVVLGRTAACEPGRPSPEARRYLEETTSPDRPRGFRNAVVCAVPSREGLEAAAARARDLLGWETVQRLLRDQTEDSLRQELLERYLGDARARLPEAVLNAYSVGVTLSARGEVVAFRIPPGPEPLFARLKAAPEARIQETAVNAEALLPEGPYDLWRQGETRRRLQDLLGAFASHPHLPKMLGRRAILDTLLDGCQEGLFVLQQTRPDRSCRTWWRDRPEEQVVQDPGLEVVLPEAAILTRLAPALLQPDRLPDLWSGESLSMEELRKYFAGGTVIQVERHGLPEPLAIPAVESQALEEAVHQAVEQGSLWLLSGPASLLHEAIPPGLLGSGATLRRPPQPIPPALLLPENLPTAWRDGQTNTLSLCAALAEGREVPPPWTSVRRALDEALAARFLEVVPGGASWPGPYGPSQEVRLRVPQISKTEPRPHPAPRPSETGPSRLVTEAALTPDQIQDLGERVADLKRAAAGLDLRFVVRLELPEGAVASPEVRAELATILTGIARV